MTDIGHYKWTAGHFRIDAQGCNSRTTDAHILVKLNR